MDLWEGKRPGQCPCHFIPFNHNEFPGTVTEETCNRPQMEKNRLASPTSINAAAHAEKICNLELQKADYCVALHE